MQKDTLTLDVWWCIGCTVVYGGVWWCMVVFACKMVYGGVWWCMVVYGGVIIQALVAALVSRRPLASSKVVQELEVEGDVSLEVEGDVSCVCGGVGGTH